MSKASVRTLTAVLDGRVLQLEIGNGREPRTESVEMRFDFGPKQEFEEPGWRDIGVGAGNGFVYWWSARHVVAQGTDDLSRAAEIATDEDILFVFALAGVWLLICETSVRLLRGPDEVGRLEFGEVLSDAVWRDPHVSLRGESGKRWEVTVTDRGLEQQ